MMEKNLHAGAATLRQLAVGKPAALAPASSLTIAIVAPELRFGQWQLNSEACDLANLVLWFEGVSKDAKGLPARE
jgi:hypothetical protein